MKILMQFWKGRGEPPSHKNVFFFGEFLGKVARQLDHDFLVTSALMRI